MAKLLIVEDDDSVRSLAVRALQWAGHEVDSAADGAAGLSCIHAAEGRYDLVVSDIRMPGMSGVDMARAAGLAFPKIRILLITGYADQMDDLAALGPVVCDVLQKPFSLHDIRDRVDQALGAVPRSAAA